MKLLSSLFLVLALAVPQITLASKGRAAKPKTNFEELAKKKGLDLNAFKRAKTAGERGKLIAKAAPAIAADIGSNSENVSKTLTYNPLLTEMVLKSTEDGADARIKEVVGRLVDVYAAKMQEIDSNSNEALRMGEVAKLLSAEKVETQYVDFADLIAKNIAEKNMTPVEAFMDAAQFYANRKGMSREEWLKKLKECLTA